MMIRYDDCRCEDYPCCGHYDSAAPEADYCDVCGYEHSSAIRCSDDDDDIDYGDEGTDELGEYLDDEPFEYNTLPTGRSIRVNAFGQRLRGDAPELPGDSWLDDNQNEEY